MFLLTDGWWGCADKADELITLLVKRARKEGSLRNGRFPESREWAPGWTTGAYRGELGAVRDSFPALKVSHQPPGLSLLFLYFLEETRQKSRLKSLQARGEREGGCRAQVRAARWREPLASAAPYSHREASTSVTRSTRQASGCASGQVFLHIVGPFFQRDTTVRLRGGRTGLVDFRSVSVWGGQLYSLFPKMFLSRDRSRSRRWRRSGGREPRRAITGRPTGGACRI